MNFSKFVEVKKFTAHAVLSVFGSYANAVGILGLFGLCWWRYNINLAPVLLLWLAVKNRRGLAGAGAWLTRLFGKKAIWLAVGLGIAAFVFYAIFAHYFHTTVVMNWMLGADQNRLLADFTQINKFHGRCNVHPFYVLFWQTLFQLLFAPAGNYAISELRLLIAFFSGVNITLFSLFVSRLTASRWANVIMTALLVLSFPQIFHSAQIFESFIFTQTAVLLGILYFSFVIPARRYHLPSLLALALFIVGNNIAYFAAFVIFYLFLLVATWNNDETAQNPQAICVRRFRFPLSLRRIIVFALWFTVGFNVLLFAQWLLYGSTVPSNIVSLLKPVLGEKGEKLYISFNFNVARYAADFFGALFAKFPFSLGKINPWGFGWAVLLVIPFIFFRRLRDLRFFAALALAAIFFFVFHDFYGARQLDIYSPVFIAVWLCVLAYAFQVLTDGAARVAKIGGVALVVTVAFFNLVGTTAIAKINRFVYQDRSIANQREEDHGTQFKILRGIANNDLDLAFIRRAEEQKNAGKFFFGLENRRKLVLENGALRDFKTGEVIANFPKLEVVILPASWTAIFKADNPATFKAAHRVVHTIREDAKGVFLDNKLIAGTEGKITIPNFSKYRYPDLMKTLYHEIMFSIIDGVPYARLSDYSQKPRRLVSYRDIAYVGLFLEAVGRGDLIEKFVRGIDEMYDANRGVQEPDNLGQILYLQSLVKKPNRALIDRIVAEARRIKDADGNLTGTTDGARSSAYQNGWLIFGLRKLGMDAVASEFNPRSAIDDNGYSRLLWFTLGDKTMDAGKNDSFHSPRSPLEFSWQLLKLHRKQDSYTEVSGQQFPYHDVAMAHYARLNGDVYRNPVLTQVVYPLTWGDGTRPHIWHAVELFMFLRELRR